MLTCRFSQVSRVGHTLKHYFNDIHYVRPPLISTMLPFIYRLSSLWNHQHFHHDVAGSKRMVYLKRKATRSATSPAVPMRPMAILFSCSATAAGPASTPAFVGVLI